MGAAEGAAESHTQTNDNQAEACCEKVGPQEDLQGGEDATEARNSLEFCGKEHPKRFFVQGALSFPRSERGLHGKFAASICSYRASSSRELATLAHGKIKGKQQSILKGR